MLTLCVAWIGCATTKQEALKNSVETYIKALRRGDPDMAASLVIPEKKVLFSKNAERIDQDLFISQIELKGVKPDEKGDSAVVILLLEVFSHKDSSVQVARRQYLWKYNSNEKLWQVDASSPFGE